MEELQPVDPQQELEEAQRQPLQDLERLRQEQQLLLAVRSQESRLLPADALVLQQLEAAQ